MGSNFHGPRGRGYEALTGEIEHQGVVLQRTLLTPRQQWRERQRRILHYLVTLARTGRIDYAGLPPPPDGWDEPHPEEAPGRSLPGTERARRPVDLLESCRDGDSATDVA